MNWIVKYLWLIPALPLLSAAASSIAPQSCRKFSFRLAAGSMGAALVLAVIALVHCIQGAGDHGGSREVFNFAWFEVGDTWLKLGWVLDPLTAVMLVMVTLVGLLIFIFSSGYMEHDHNYTRFFTFLSLFAAAMLGLLIANSLLMLFMCWELVGLTSYLLIGFWYHKPSAAAAAKKAFIVTRIGDLAFLLGMVWLYAETGTLLFYDDGKGCLEQSSLTALLAQTTSLGIAASTGIGLLIFCGAIGKSGQVPLHVWLPDAMEGPTPVSALIHAATMVAAGVFLVARVYPLMELAPEHTISATLQVISWVGAITAIFAASIAVAQNDIKRILAYSTVSQLGFMMLGLGVGGVAVGMFHLIAHAFFKALLFLGAGSVIHGCHEEQDIRKMGGLRKWMPVTFATYAIGMMALSGVPILFSGFWSKDSILHAAYLWKPSQWPFHIGIVAAFCTAFYMTRQMAFVFFGEPRTKEVHESPKVMTVPLVVLAVFAMAIGLIGTPFWPWMQTFLGAPAGHGHHSTAGVVGIMCLSVVAAFTGIGLSWAMYRKHSAEATDPLERLQPDIFELLRRKYYVDEAYQWLVVRFNAWFANLCDLLDALLWNGVVFIVAYAVVGISWVDSFFDKYVLNSGFDQTCERLSQGGWRLSLLQRGRIQSSLRIIGLALVVLTLLLLWGCHAS